MVREVREWQELLASPEKAGKRQIKGMDCNR